MRFRSHRSRSAGLEYGVVFLGYVLLTMIMLFPLPLEFGQAIPGDSFDGWQNYWNLWWVKQALVVQGSNPFYTDMLFHPTGVSLAFHTLNIFNGLFSLPIQLTFGLFPAYNAVVAFSFSVGGFGAYLLARYVLGRAGWRGKQAIWPAFTAGLIYTFSPFHFAHLLGHMQVFSLQWLPFAVLALLLAIDRVGSPPPRPGKLLQMAGMAALFLFLAGLCDWYFALYLGLFTALLLVYRFLCRSLTWRHVGIIAVAWAGFLTLTAPMWIPMAREARQDSYMVPDRAHAIALSADLLAFVTPNEFHPLWGEWAGRFAERYTSSTSERIVFAGFLPLALGALAALRLGRRSRFWWISTVTFAVLALGPMLHVGGRSSFTAAGIAIPLPYAVLYETLPFIRIARSVARLDVMVMLSLGVLAALGLAYAIHRHRWTARRPALPGLIASAIVCFEFLSLPYPFSLPDTPGYYEQIAQETDEFAVLNLPMNWDRPGYLLYQTVHGKPKTSAYISRDDPRTLVYRAPVLQELRRLGGDILTDDLGAIGVSVLEWLDIRYVILDSYKMPGGTEREVTYSIAETVFAGIPPAFSDHRLTVYQVEAPLAVAPFAVLGETGWGRPEEREGRIWRPIIGVSADLLVVSDGREPLSLSFITTGPADTRLSITVNGEDTDGVTSRSSESQIQVNWRPIGAETVVSITTETGSEKGLIWISGVRVESVP